MDRSQAATFKLLRILPPTLSPNKAITCDLLTEVPLETAPEYEALSYTWGTTTQDQPVNLRTISSQSPSAPAPKTEIVYVTKHLYAAFLRLQLPSLPRLLWIDQLCIDQSNVVERNAQVKLMVDIYRRAERTVVWLGDASILDQDKDAIIDAADRMNFRPVEREYSTPEDQIILKQLIGFRTHGKPYDLGQRRRRVLAELLNRSWFTRAWVFQEVVVAKKGIVFCGPLEMDMDVFINLLDGVCDLDLQEVGEAASIMHSSRGYKPMFAIRETRFESRNGLSSSKKSQWLSTLWQAMGNLNATNPRDKVYAFLAFADSRAESRISPSYEKSVESVYTDATVRSIHARGSLDVLELAIKGDESLAGLPSWVPDFSHPLPSLPFMTHNVGSTEFDASRGSRHSFVYHHTDSSTLSVRGLILGKVTSIYPIAFQDSESPGTLHHRIGLDGVVAWVKSQFKTAPVGEPPQNLVPNLEASILRTLLAQGAASDDTPANMDYTNPEAILAVYHNEPAILQAKDNGLFDNNVRLLPSAADPETITALQIQYRYYKWMQKVAGILHKKKFFFLSRGFAFGLAYQAIGEGDSGLC
ncbi:MAG: hypothetical protein L6R40_006072 [Gallowayella cf. fulva]|nr:MAG: hypothetical protein L6R40_006072 [Xanthomendoza cf. fulva]